MKSLRLGSGDRICPDARYLAANKPLKIIINTIYQYVIMLSLGRQDSPAPRPPPFQPSASFPSRFPSPPPSPPPPPPFLPSPSLPPILSLFPLTPPPPSTLLSY